MSRIQSAAMLSTIIVSFVLGCLITSIYYDVEVVYKERIKERKEAYEVGCLVGASEILSGKGFSDGMCDYDNI